MLLYIADSCEIERHLMVTNIAIQIIGIIAVALIVDSETFNDICKKVEKRLGIQSNK